MPGITDEIDYNEPLILYRDEDHRKIFSSIQLKIRNQEGERTIRSICLTSSIRFEGTSTWAMNLAAATAENNDSRILLIDGNLRHPGLHKVFGMENKTGFSDLLFGNAQANEAIYNTGIKNLSFIPAGGFQVNLNRVLNKAVIKPVLDDIGTGYEWVIIDSPAVTAFPDAVTYSSVVDGTIIVIAAHRTRREIIQETQRQLEQSGAHILGTVLNRREYVIPDNVYRRL
ncbi:MAG: polysaccharide biosynthesis tyrosine autokinase [candidate division Zixibacteria bacterium]|nr:polysaccharide biosynthesis tyrosine autokinase [candidate division Zixibacteria bacterium]